MSVTLAELRERQKLVRDFVDVAFPAGARVWPIGVKTGNWGGTVERLDAVDRVSMAADYVLVSWDNGNRYAVPFDEIERR